jgi:hypothetical protein
VESVNGTYYGNEKVDCNNRKMVLLEQTYKNDQISKQNANDWEILELVAGSSNVLFMNVVMLL